MADSIAAHIRGHTHSPSPTPARQVKAYVPGGRTWVGMILSSTEGVSRLRLTLCYRFLTRRNSGIIHWFYPGDI